MVVDVTSTAVEGAQRDIERGRNVVDVTSSPLEGAGASPLPRGLQKLP
jgi:hypothetical protein